MIGAGHNGLTAAAYLAKAGKKVLVLERREIVGGCAVTEEVDPERAPGCRVSTASYIASMLRPTIIRDLKLADYGLKMVACDPGVQAAFEDGDVAAWWGDEPRMREELDPHCTRRHRCLFRDRTGAEAPRRLPAAVLPRGAAGSQRNGSRKMATALATVSALQRPDPRRHQQTDTVSDRLSGRLPRPAIPIREAQAPDSREQSLWQARRTLPARHGHGPAVSPAERRRRRSAGLAGTRHRRHGRDHPGAAMAPARTWASKYGRAPVVAASTLRAASATGVTLASGEVIDAASRRE